MTAGELMHVIREAALATDPALARWIVANMAQLHAIVEQALIARRRPYTLIERGVKWPTYKGETLSWGTPYNSPAEQQAGYPRERARLAALPSIELQAEHAENAKSSLNAMFGHNAKKILVLIEEEMAQRQAMQTARTQGRTPAQRFADRVYRIVEERGIPYANMTGTSGIHSDALRTLDVDDPEAASVGRGRREQADALVSDAMIQAGATAAWDMSFPHFLKRSMAIPPGLLDAPRVEVAGVVEEKAANARVEEAKAKVVGTKEGKTALDNEGHSWFRKPGGKTAAKAWAAYEEARENARNVRERWREYQQWQLWMATRKHARHKGYTPIAHDETPPMVSS